MEKIIGSIAIVLLINCCCSCATYRIDRDIIEHQRAIDAVEERNRILNATIVDNIERLGAIREQIDKSATTSAGIGAKLELVIQLFEQYDNEVRKLLQSYREVEILE